MMNNTTKPDSLQPAAEKAVDLFDNWFDPIETEVRVRAREFIEELLRDELDTALARPRYGRSQMAGNEARAGVAGHRHGSRTRSLTGTFGPIEIAVPRARLTTSEGGTTEWKSQALRAYQRRTLAADALIASTYLAGTNTRRVRRALAALFGGTVGKDTVSRTWRKVKSDWDAWNTRSLAGDPIVRLILDGTIIRVRLDRKATSISLLVILGVRADGQKVLLAIKSMGGESAEAWRTVLDDLIKRGLRRPEFLIVDGAPGLDKAIASIWDGVPVQRCTVHKHRNLFAHAPERLHDEITADYNDMIYATTPEEIEVHRQGLHPQMEAQASCCRRQPGRGGGTLVHLYSPAAEPMAQLTHHKCNRAFARGIKAADQDANCSAVGQHRSDVVLGAVRFRADQHAQSGWLADPRHKAHRSAD